MMPRVFVDTMGREIPHDGRGLVTWRISVYVVAFRQGRVLFVEPTYLDGKLELPGGEVEVGETLLEGAVRECWEESGYLFSPDVPDPTFVGEQFFCDNNGSSFRHSVFLAFVGTVSDSPDPFWRPSEEDEGVTVHWMKREELSADLIHPNHWAALLRTGTVNELSVESDQV